MKGEIVWTYVYDTGGELDLRRVGEIVQRTPAFERIEARLHAPRNVSLPRPLALRFPASIRDTDHGRRSFEASARIYSIGAVAVTIRTAFEAKDFGELRSLGTLQLVGMAGGEPVEAFARSLYDEVHRGLEGAIVEPYGVAMAAETYQVFCVTEPDVSAGSLLQKERRAMAALLANEPDPARLGPEEVEDNLRYWYRYYEDDLVIADWDYALVVEPTGRYEDTLFVMELANLQLLELRTYDAYLDGVLDRAYEDLDRFHKPGGIFRSARDLQEDLSEARIDLIRVSDDIDNIGKIFGDWYLAKLYLGLTQRFHLADWQRALDSKLQALNGVYTIASHEVEHRRGVLLESMIVLLFVLDLVLLAVTAF
ncbi:MAG TPA: hypothetical protein VI997_05830 [Candidatus Thermoplasmatota archaeon]|nr:hypothetical protein [Candidatus Thermoplasmatota archaeon]